MSLLPRWQLKSDGIIFPEHRLPAAQTLIVALQHVIAMFGATVLAPILMGLDPNVAVLFSGIGTLIFFFAVGGRVPSYLGSSFSFIAVVIAATAYAGQGPNPKVGVALGGILAAGAVYTLIGIAVTLAGHRWVEKLMPPVVTGAVVAVIGLNLAPIAVKSVSGSDFDTAIALATIVSVAMVAVYAPGIWRRISILTGTAIAYLAYLILANGFQLGQPVVFDRVASAAWLGWPDFSMPVFEPRAVALISPVAVILVAENLAHLKAVSTIIGRNLDPYIGRTFIGDGIATMLAASVGGTAVTTYAENIGVMAVTKIYSSLVFVVAALFAILLGLSPKFGALILTIPVPVIGGLSIFVFGLITAAAGRIWVENRVDFTKAVNLITVGATLVVGAGDLGLKFGEFSFGGIVTASFGAIILFQLLRLWPGDDADEEIATAPSWASHSDLLVMDELAHRVKNTLALVEAIVTQTLRTAESLDQARRSFSMRMAALAQAYDLLLGRTAGSADVREIAAGVAAVHGGPQGRIRILGPAVHLNSNAALALTLILHELATNAAKYGALSSEEGHVEIEWGIIGGAKGDRFSLRWSEHGGPPVVSPTRKGFGSRLIERALSGEFGGQVDVSYEPKGLVCTIGAPLTRLCQL